MSLYGMKCFFFGKEKKNIFVSSEKVSTFLNAFSAWKFCNNPIQVEEENGIAVGLICFLKIVCQNEKYLKSQINSWVNMSNKNFWWPTFLMASFKFSWTFLRLSVSIFNKFCSTSWDLLLRIYWNLFFHNTAWNLLHVIYLYILKSVKNFKAKNKLKELILADISCIQQLSHAI